VIFQINIQGKSAAQEGRVGVAQLKKQPGKIQKIYFARIIQIFGADIGGVKESGAAEKGAA
jgi:hypothetical protein